MQGHVRARNGHFEIRAFLGVDPRTGKSRYTTRTVRGGKREAQRALGALIGEIESGKATKTASTVGNLLEAWFEAASAGFSPKTVKETRGYMDRQLLPDLGALPLRRLKTADLDHYYARLSVTGAVDGGPLAPGTVKRIHGILRRALQQGVRWDWIGANPAASSTPPRVPAPRLTPPSTAGVARLFEFAQRSDPDFAVFLLVAAVTGARRSELIALRWPDLSIDGPGAAVVVIGRGVVSGPNGLVEKDTKTHQVRRLSLDATTAARLRDHRRSMTERATACGASVNADGFVFSHDPRAAEPWYPDSVSRQFRRLRTKSGLDGVRLHDLRHYVATQLITAGVDVRTVAGRLGHRNASTTLNVYAQFVPEADQAAAELLERGFAQAAG